ncbi:MAG: ABC transporter substrate-binding protein [Actinomycetota bacterium]
MRIRTLVVFVGIMGLITAGCGQKPGVAEQFAGGTLPPGVTVNEEGQLVDEAGNIVGTTTDTGFTSGLGDSSGGSISGTDTSGVGDGGGEVPVGEAPPSSSGEAPASGDTTGVTDTTIKIGTHAPLTGAAPVPSDSAEKAKDIYFRWLEEEKKVRIHGRRVEVILKNDNYNPSQAVAVCKEMVEKDKVFILSGSAGTDQIQACARYAASVGVPYLSAGVTETGLTGLPLYFATTMTYNDQGPLLADYLVSDLGAKGEKNGMLRFDTPNFEDAHDGFLKGMRSQGAQVHYDRAVCKCATSTEAQTVVQEMKTAGIENVNVLTSPVWFLQVLQAARTQQYTPQWVGVGITMTFDTVAAVGCRNGTLDKSKFFAPFPAWIDSNRFDADFQKAVRAFYESSECNSSGCGDDFIWLGWTASRTLADALLLAGRNLSRELFVYELERARGLKNGINPELNFSPDDHFGASEVHVSEARCSDNRWHTLKSFVSDF